MHFYSTLTFTLTFTLTPMTNTLSTLKLSGIKTQEFLQGQLTCDLRLLTLHGQYSLAACCDHKGRMLANFWVMKWETDFLLILPENMIEITKNHLQKYAVFSKVTLSVGSHPEAMTDVAALFKNRIEKGIVILQPKTSLLFTPQMINLQKLGGVSFEKGCYVGQEIIARTEHLGTLKRHLHRLEINSDTPLAPGDPLFKTVLKKGLLQTLR